jgi:hypothetical protein
MSSSSKNFFQKMVQYNTFSGVILFALGTSISFLAMFKYHFYYYGDIQLIIGAFIGTIFSLSFLKEKQSPIKVGLVVGLMGGALSVLFLSVINWITSIFLIGFNFIIFIYFVSEFGIQGLIIGLVIGVLMGFWYYRKELVTKAEKKSGEQLVDEDFFDKLRED